jgi:DNA-directed RNA polymerase subunit L
MAAEAANPRIRRRRRTERLSGEIAVIVISYQIPHPIVHSRNVILRPVTPKP